MVQQTNNQTPDLSALFQLFFHFSELFPAHYHAVNLLVCLSSRPITAFFSTKQHMTDRTLGSAAHALADLFHEANLFEI